MENIKSDFIEPDEMAARLGIEKPQLWDWVRRDTIPKCLVKSFTKRTVKFYRAKSEAWLSGELMIA